MKHATAVNNSVKSHRKFPFLIVLFLSICSVSLSQINEDYPALVKKAEHFYKNQDYKLSVSNYAKAFEIYDDNDFDLYNAACSAALGNDSKQAFLFLNKSIEKGWNKVQHLQTDPDLYSLHCLDQWKVIVEKAKEIEKNTSTSAQILAKVTGFIQDDEIEMLSTLVHDRLDSRVSSAQLKIVADSILDFLDSNQIKSLASLPKTSNSSLRYSNGVKTSTEKYVYSYIPKYYDDKLKSLLMKPIGCNIIIQLEKANSDWYLSELKLENNYARMDYDMISKMSKFFNQQDTLNYRYALSSKDARLFHTGKINPNDLLQSLTVSSNLFEYIQPEDLDSYDLFNADQKVFVLSYQLQSPMNSYVQSLIAKKKEPFLDTFEIVYFKNSDNLYMISNGHKYAFYSNESLNPEQVIHTKLLDLTK